MVLDRSLDIDSAVFIVRCECSAGGGDDAVAFILPRL